MAINQAQIVQMLREFAELMKISGDTFRARAYAKAAKSVNNGINNGIGKGIREKIAEFKSTGRVQALDDLRASPIVRAHRELGAIMGAGPSTVASWIAAGIYTLAMLQKGVAAGEIKLTAVQELGLKYYDDLNTKIPRAEVELIVGDIKLILSSGIEITIAGSYRRGLPESSDIDLIVQGSSIATCLDRLRRDQRFIAVVKAGPSAMTFLWRGTCCRQIDIITADTASYPAALLYFTGSWQHNEMMRSRAKKMGMLLNQNGLYRGGKLTPTHSEEDIFAALGMEYVLPENRS